VKRRRRGPTRPNVHINIFQNLAASQDSAPEPKIEAETALEHASERDKPLVSSEWLERRSRRLDAFEQELRRRAVELDAREAELEEKEARLEADVYLREDELETRERRLAELEQNIGRRETELGSYVARLQSGFLRADAL
jgi:Skp family chaperone for outer membrane proteins